MEPPPLTDDAWTIPQFLRLDDETRRKARERFKIATPTQEPQIEAIKLKIKRHKLRKLRAEEKRLSDLIDAIGNRDPSARRKLYEAIKVVEREIDKSRAAM